MAGLLNQQPRQNAAPPPGAPGMQAPGAPGPGAQPSGGLEAGGSPEGNVTPEEQAQYDQVVTNAMEIMYDEQAMPRLLETIEAGGNPIEGIANALTLLFIRVEDSAKQNGIEISGDVKFHAATELLEQMIELAEAANIHEYSEQDMESALMLAMDHYRDARQEDGSLPVDELEQDMEMLMQADQQGRLGEVVPGAEEYAKQAQSRNPQGV